MRVDPDNLELTPTPPAPAAPEAALTPAPPAPPPPPAACGSAKVLCACASPHFRAEPPRPEEPRLLVPAWAAPPPPVQPLVDQVPWVVLYTRELAPPPPPKELSTELPSIEIELDPPFPPEFCEDTKASVGVGIPPTPTTTANGLEPLRLKVYS